MFAARNVQFQSSSSRLTSDSLPALQELADSLKTNPDLNLTIEGHTDNTGTPEYNEKLSDERAMQVKKALISMGIAEDRISVQGYGDTQPIGDNKTTGREIGEQTRGI